MRHVPIQTDELKAWSRYIHELCGVSLDITKGYLIETRLGSLLHETGSNSWSYLLSEVKSDSSHSLRNKVIDAITIQETSFFRDIYPFELLKHKLLPDLIDRRNKSGYRPVPVRILNGACSTGQEVYTAAIVIKELLQNLSNYDIRILGVDISDAALSKASYGHYTRYELDRGLPSEMIARYFEPAGDSWKVSDELRSMVAFTKANMLQPISAPNHFDIIFCRNVSIYFSEDDKIRLFKNLSRILAADGALIIGATESIVNICPEFEPRRYLRSVFYSPVFQGS